MKGRLLSILIVATLVLTMLPATALAISFEDTDGHWNEAAIDYWTDRGLMDGIGNNKFDPDGHVTRAQAAAIFARLLRLSDTADISHFTDVPANAWYAEYIALCYEAGIMGGRTATVMDPEGHLTREEMFTMFCRALHIEGQGYTGRVFSDYGKVSAYALPYVNALLNSGFIGGKTATTIDPQDHMTRAEILKLIDNTIAVYITEPGTYNVSEDTAGRLVLNVANGPVYVTGLDEDTIVINMSDSSMSANGNNIPAGEEEIIEEQKPAAPSTPTHHHSYTVVEDATCTKDGLKVCSCGAFEEIPANGHSYPDSPEWKWAENYTSATATMTCPNCVDGTTGKVLSETDSEIDVETTATCKEAGVTTYTALVVLNGAEHSMTYKVNTPATGEHVDPDGKWSDNGNGTHSKVCGCGTAFETKYCTYEVETPATCMKEGLEVCPDCGNEKVISKHDLTKTDKNVDGLCDECVKFYLGVESNGTEVTATVYKDYSAVVQLPSPSGVVDASSVTATAIMQNVASMGADYKKADLTVNTGIEGVTATIGPESYLKSCYAFGEAHANVSVQETGVEKASFTYDLKGDGETATITATPDDENDARATWQAMMSYIDAGSKETDDSYIVLSNGSFIHLGDQVLHFEEDDDLVIDNVNNIDGLKQNIKDYLKLDTTSDEDGNTIYLEAGTTLAVSNSEAVLEAPVLITLGGMEIDGQVLEDLRANSDSTSGLVLNLVNLVDSLVASLDSSNTVDIVLDFKPDDAAMPHIHNYVTVEKTCTTDGKVYCTGCDYKDVPAELVATGHQLDGTLTCGVCEKSAEKLSKFELEVSSESSVKAYVLDDYSIIVDLPASDAVVSPESLTVNVAMKNVNSLGISNERTFSKSLKTNIEMGNIQLSNYLSAVYGGGHNDPFGGATVKIDVAGSAVTYTFHKYNSLGADEIYAQPVSVSAARAAWQALIKGADIITDTASDEDSWITVGPGSEIHYGGDVLALEGDYATKGVTLNNLNNLLSSLGSDSEIRKYVVLKCDATNETKIVVGAGSELKMGQSSAKLGNKCTIAITGLFDVDVDVEGNTFTLDGELQKLQNAQDMSMAVKTLISMLNRLIYSVDLNETINVNVTFG